MADGKLEEVLVDEGKTSVLDKSHLKVSVLFKSLEFSVTRMSKKQAVTKTILKDITGNFRPGRLTAIMGNSGAGKTSLLNLMAGNIVVSEGKANINGQIFLNGARVQPDFMKKVSGFVFQDDLILSTMTVREAISMSAILRLPETMPLEEKMSRVDDIIRILRLEKAANTIVGSDIVKGISGGERKRTSMAMEMVINPSILFLDEPTSGLDTFTAYSVVTTLKDLASQGRTVVATIHQPSSDIFMLFDDLLLLSEGRVVYYGEAKDAVSYFARAGYKCPQYMNPSDYIFMHILNNSDEVQVRQESKETKDASVATTKEQLEKINEFWQTSEEGSMVKSLEPPQDKGINPGLVKQTSGFLTQFVYLFQRAFRNALRNRLMVVARVAQNLFFGLIIGLIYLRLPDKSFEDQFRNRPGSLYFLTMNMIMGSLFGTLGVFATEKRVFLREYGAGYYCLSSYFWSKLMAELPFYVVLPFITIGISYYMIGFNPLVTRFFTQYGIAILTTNTGTALGIFFACLFDNINVALATVPAIMLPILIFSGLLLSNSSLPASIDWVQYISPGKYGFSAYLQNELRGLTVTNCNQTITDCNGDQILANMKIGQDFSVGECSGILIAFMVTCVLLANLALWRTTKSKVKN